MPDERRIIRVYDALLDPDLVLMTYTWAVRSARLGWRFGDTADDKTDNAFWGATVVSHEDEDVPSDIADAEPRVGQIWSRLQEAFRPAQFDLRQVFVNGQTYGLDNAIHTDRPDDEEGWYTALVYLNPKWTIHDGGETMFYNAARTDVIGAVVPKPGRVILFDARHPHWGRPPTRNCKLLRVTLAYRLTRLPHSPLPQ